MTFRNIALVALIVVFGALPWWSDASVQNIATKVLVAGLFAMSFNLVWGQAGLLSFGQAAYFGIGTFAAVFGMGISGGVPLVPLPFIPLLGALAGLAIGIVAGWFATMRSGIYFAMITFAFAELLYAIAYQWDAVFGGEAGVRARRSDFGPISFQSTESVYLLTFFWVVVALLTLWWLQRSPFGQVMKGLRDREDRLAFIGYDTHLVKTAAFCLAAFYSGLAGGLLAITNESANVSLFASHQSTNVVLNTIIGGSSMFFGPMVGAAFTTLFGYYAASYTTHWPLYLGLLFVAVVLFAPKGIVGLIHDVLFRGKLQALWSGTTLARLIAVIAFLIPTILLIEIVGEISSTTYEVARRAARGAWPPVEVFGISWSPFGVQTILAVVVCFAIVIVVRRVWLPSAAKRVSRFAGSSRLVGGEAAK